MENITNAIPVVAADDAVDDDDAKWLSVPLEDVPIGKRRRLSSLSAERKDGKSSSSPKKPTTITTTTTMITIISIIFCVYTINDIC